MNPDNSGTFGWMISELQQAEDAGERVWLISHVPSGWDGNVAMPNPSNLFYQIVDRYSPHVIANVFFGHTHEDQFTIYYAGNASVQTADTALMTGWIGPSVTPMTNVNSGFRLYEVDTGDFSVYNAYNFFSDVSSYDKLDATQSGPRYEFEYSARDTYAPFIEGGWDPQAPLDANFWHRVTEAMERNIDLVDLHNSYQGRQSDKTPACNTQECQQAKICYMRSGSSPISESCIRG